MAIDIKKICDDIELTDEGITIIAYTTEHGRVIVPHDALKWRNPYEDGDDYDLPLFLRLKEISEQLLAMHYQPVFYVWYEMGLSGKIYEYGNHPSDPHWREHGETKGFA